MAVSNGIFSIIPFRIYQLFSDQKGRKEYEVISVCRGIAAFWMLKKKPIGHFPTSNCNNLDCLKSNKRTPNESL